MCFLFVTLTVLAFYCVYILIKGNLNYWKKRHVKYMEPIPFLGNMLPVITKSMGMFDFIQAVYNKFPEERYVGIFQFTTPILFVKDLELIKSITIKNFDNFVDHHKLVDTETDPLWDKNLFSSKGDRWRELRQTMSPVFTSSKMRMMFTLMEECAKQLIDYLKEHDEDIIKVEMKDLTTRYTNDVIASTAFGIRCNSLKNKENDFLLAGRELTDFSGLKRLAFILYGNCPRLTKFLKFKMISSRVGNFFKSVITETIKLREEKNIIRPDLIHLLMLSRKGKLKYEDYMNLPETGFATVQESEMGKSSKNFCFLTDEDITAQALIFFFGGFDTVSTLMCFASYELAINPYIQKRRKEEIIQTLQECEEKITYERLLGMKYLDMVVSETLRKWPQGLWLDRKCTKPFEIEPEREEEKKLKLNVGDICWIPVVAIHRDPQYYPNPEVFDPERFSDANKDKIYPGVYLPFGNGPRNCIGSRFALLETKMFLFHLLSNFDIVITDKTQVPLKIDKNNAFLQGEKGFHLGLKRSISV